LRESKHKNQYRLGGTQEHQSPAVVQKFTLFHSVNFRTCRDLLVRNEQKKLAPLVRELAWTKKPDNFNTMLDHRRKRWDFLGTIVDLYMMHFELSTVCRRSLRLNAPDGKMRETDCANMQGLFRIIQSILPPKAEPFKKWSIKVGDERIQDMNAPVRSLDPGGEYWQKHGRSEKWIPQQMIGAGNTQLPYRLLEKS
jgi:hypothetical protein